MNLDSLPIPNLSYWLLQTVAMLVTAWILPGLKIKGPIPALMTVIVLAFVNSHIWDAALFFHVPDALSTKVLVLLLSNGLIFWMIVKLLPGIEITGVLSAILAPIIFSLSSVLISEGERHIDWQRVYQSTLSGVEQVKGYVKSEKEPITPPR